MSSDLEARRAYPKKDQWAGPSLLKYGISRQNMAGDTGKAEHIQI